MEEIHGDTTIIITSPIHAERKKECYHQMYISRDTDMIWIERSVGGIANIGVKIPFLVTHHHLNVC